MGPTQWLFNRMAFWDVWPSALLRVSLGLEVQRWNDQCSLVAIQKVGQPSMADPWSQSTQPRLSQVVDIWPPALMHLPCSTVRETQWCSPREHALVSRILEENIVSLALRVQAFLANLVFTFKALFDHVDIVHYTKNLMELCNINRPELMLHVKPHTYIQQVRWNIAWLTV